MLKFKHVRPFNKGSGLITINVEKDDQPFGQIWTFRTSLDTKHPWHAKPLDGEHKSFFAKEGGFTAARTYFEQCAA